MRPSGWALPRLWELLISGAGRRRCSPAGQRSRGGEPPVVVALTSRHNAIRGSAGGNDAPQGLSALLVAGVLGLGFVGLLVSTLAYDDSNPRDRPNAYYSVESVVVDRPVAEVFRFVQREIPSVYTRMSPMHEKFEILNAEALVEGAEIDCVEGDEKEVVRNHYVVEDVVENRLIAMSSTPTRVYDRTSGELVAEVDVWDYLDFESLGPDRTRLTQTVVLDMKSPVLKSVVDVAAFLSGSRRDWERQFEEQLQNLARFAEEAEPVR